MGIFKGLFRTRVAPQNRPIPYVAAFEAFQPFSNGFIYPGISSSTFCAIARIISCMRLCDTLDKKWKPLS